MTDSFSESRFRGQVDKALVAVRKILTNTRFPEYPEDVPHTYPDKYLLAEFLAKTALAAEVDALEGLGMTKEAMDQVVAWSAKKSITLRFKAEETCVFDRKDTRKITSDERVVESSFLGGIISKAERIITRVTEYYWKFNLSYEIFVFQGTDLENKITILERKCKNTVSTTSEAPPRAETTVHPSLDLDLTPLFQHLLIEPGNPESVIHFPIDRASPHCRTPRRNPEIQGLLDHLSLLYQWCGRLRSFFLEEIFNLQPDHNCDISKLHSRDIFNPVVPLFEVPSKKDEGRMKLKTARSEKPGTLTSSEHQRPGVLDFSNFFSFIEEHKKSIKEKLSDLSIFPSNDKLVTFSEAKLVTLVYHLRDIAQHFSDGVEYIEKMLFDQIVQAIGKEVTPVDFTNYMRYHNRVLFKAEYLPKGFCYPIKRPDHYPEGVLSIESELNDGSLPQSIPTVVRSAPAMRPMKFALNASTEVTFMGHRYLHAWVSHQFSGDTGYNLYMNARAHQFSSFILLIGTMGAVDLFQPKYGIIIQNKDDLKIPLMVETIPTPKQFRDAIESLSPEQQRFAKAYRSMQLSGTLFSICVIQIKPQMEKLLRLPQDSLTKEIQLSQDLMELFIKYQIPSDLLTYDGPENAPVATKITSVQQNVNSIKEVIQKAIQLQIKEQQKQQAYLHPTPILPPPEPEPILEVYEEEERDYREYELDMKMDKMMLFDDAPVQMSLSLDMVSIKEDIAPKREKEVMKKKSAAPAKSRKAMAPSPSPAKPSAAPSSNASSIAVPKSPVAEAKVAPAEAPKAATPAEPPKPATPAEPPKPATPETTQPQEKAKELLPATSAIQIATEEEPDYTKIPTSLDDKYGKYDEDNALHATTITASTPWSMSFQANILSPRQTKSLEVADLETAKNAAFDLLDALTCSGAILVEDADFHVLLGVAHQFEKSLMGTLVQDNINPIEKLERSVLLTATTVMGKDVKELVKEEVLERIRMHSPNLLAADEEE